MSDELHRRYRTKSRVKIFHKIGNDFFLFYVTHSYKVCPPYGSSVRSCQQSDRCSHTNDFPRLRYLKRYRYHKSPYQDILRCPHSSVRPFVRFRNLWEHLSYLFSLPYLYYSLLKFLKNPVWGELHKTPSYNPYHYPNNKSPIYRPISYSIYYILFTFLFLI